MKYRLKKIINGESLNFFRQISSSIEKIDKDILSLIDDMINILHNNGAIGIAGIMVGAPKRVVVVDLQENNRKKPLILLNPEIIERSSEIVEGEESSISLDNVKEKVPRHRSIKVKYLDKNNVEKTLDAEDLLSICLQHEIDYLDGKLFIDYLNEEKRNEIINYIVNSMKIKTVMDDMDILRTKCVRVEKVDESITEFLDRMLDFMYKSKGIGLAANQVGVAKRMVVIDLRKNDEKNPLFLINPEIIYESSEMVCEEEGCLSIPGERANVVRAKNVKVKYQDRTGKEQVIEADGLLSICLQHELDHLNGKIFIDHLSKVRRDIIFKKLKKR
ncbi:MAG: peptide deformylase [Rickettsiales bacterium]|jgi:peptide deformylase|nr:peptide deformylase [Rickettsiales bacterium]